MSTLLWCGAAMYCFAGLQADVWWARHGKLCVQPRVVKELGARLPDNAVAFILEFASMRVPRQMRTPRSWSELESAA